MELFLYFDVTRHIPIIISILHRFLFINYFVNVTQRLEVNFCSVEYHERGPKKTRQNSTLRAHEKQCQWGGSYPGLHEYHG